MTDDNDRVLLTHLLSRCYTPVALEPGFAPGPAYPPTPPEASLEACISHVQGLPATDTAQVFSMHPNADTAFQLQVTSGLLQFTYEQSCRVAAAADDDDAAAAAMFASGRRARVTKSAVEVQLCTVLAYSQMCILYTVFSQSLAVDRLRVWTAAGERAPDQSGAFHAAQDQPCCRGSFQ